ncbi:hypothetical protein [Chroococcidiopsis sp.]|uniref:hypothetical protein n=1 Tax=Chroococcidiopsis sp. TaxID=3088168 RepID=UPI003F308EFB
MTYFRLRTAYCLYLQGCFRSLTRFYRLFSNRLANATRFIFSVIVPLFSVLTVAGSRELQVQRGRGASGAEETRENLIPNSALPNSPHTPRPFFRSRGDK